MPPAHSVRGDWDSPDLEISGWRVERVEVLMSSGRFTTSCCISWVIGVLCSVWSIVLGTFEGLDGSSEMFWCLGLDADVCQIPVICARACSCCDCGRCVKAALISIHVTSPTPHPPRTIYLLYVQKINPSFHSHSQISIGEARVSKQATGAA